MKTKIKPSAVAGIIVSLALPSNYVHAFGTIGNTQPFATSNKFLGDTSKKLPPFTAFTSLPRNCKRGIILAAKKDPAPDEYEEYEEEYAEDDDDEWEYEYEEEEEEEEYEEETEEEEEEEDEDDSHNIPLQDDPDDPLYTEQKRLIEQTVAHSEGLNKAKLMMVDSEDAPEFMRKNLNNFLDEKLKEAGIDMSQVDEEMAKIEISEDEAEEAIKEEIEKRKGMNFNERQSAFIQNLGSDSDAFPPDGDVIYQTSEDDETLTVKNEDLVRLQNALEELVGTIDGYTDGSKVQNKQAMIRPNHELERLDHQTLDEINLCLNASAVNANGQEYAETIKNEDPLRWLLYDLDFNVTNLMLASCAHNPSAPLLLNHWMPQLCAYSRYADVREREFQFSWKDCERADMDELKRYFQGLGHEKIPTFTAKETNIIDVETEYDQEDMTMSAFENWMDEVYDDENEDLYFDDEDFQPEHNVFDFDYGMEDSDTVRSFKTEFEEFNKEHSNETQAWREQYAKATNYERSDDEQGTKMFRGHLVVACCGSDHDLELAEKITARMNDDFGKEVYVETRVYNHARQEDNVYEIWLESYDIQLIHSRRGAFYNANQWDGPPDVDDKQLDYIADKVKYLISDDARYSYHIHEFFTEV